MKRILPLLLVFCSLTAFTQPANIQQNVVAESYIYFEFGKADLQPEGITLLDSLVLKVNTISSASIQLEAHTDAIGSMKDNLKLSEKRALAVQNFLVSQGVPDSLFTISFHGEEIPTASNDTDSGRQLNRRVLVRLSEDIPPYDHELTGKVLDPETGQPLRAEVVLKLEGKQPRIAESNPETGEFSVPFYAKEKGLGIMTVFAENYFHKSLVVDLNKAETLNLTIKPERAEVGESLKLEKLYFVGNQAVLLPHSIPELKKLLRFMQINPTLKVEIGGHVNHPFTKPEDLPEWSFNLSVNRAKVIYEYLAENGIDSTKMTYKGYGNSKMVFPETRLESEMKMNRRVEITVLYSDSTKVKKLPPTDEQ